jgi:hypothetical protein
MKTQKNFLALVKESNRLISELKKENPNLNFVMENVTNMQKYIRSISCEKHYPLNYQLRCPDCKKENQ